MHLLQRFSSMLCVFLHFFISFRYVIHVDEISASMFKNIKYGTIPLP